MFGDNPIRKQDLTSSDSLSVISVFRTIQGEGPFAGQPAIFVRLHGCNLRCHFCDTDFETNAFDADIVDLYNTIEDLAGKGINLVVITGGEPFRQNIVPFIDLIATSGRYKVQIETAGTLSLPEFPYGDPQVSVVVSPKTGKVHNDMRNATAWKYIYDGIPDPDDGLPSMSTQKKGELKYLARPINNAPVYLQPMDVDEVTNKRLMIECADTCMKHGYTYSFQMHKYIGVE